MDIINLASATPFITKDGSEIRELLSYRNSSIRGQSLAEARIAVGGATTPHHHPHTEEIYYIIAGQGLMKMPHARRAVTVGDAIAIPAGTIHQIVNTGDETLTLLCCCVPGYEDHDTIMFPDWTDGGP